MDQEETKGGFVFPQINLERRQNQLHDFTERLFSQTSQQAIRENAANATQQVQSRLAGSVNFVSSKLSVSRTT